MNKYNLEIPRKRHLNLLIVEGNHEKDKLFQIIFHAFPELEINIDDVWIYGTNIYMLYNDLLYEYGDTWYDEDVDLPFIVGKKKNHTTTLNKKDFTNIYLIFDYERHDPNFSEQKIKNMQRYFCDSTDMGKLYVNYPMIESYQHFTCFPDTNFENLTVGVTLRPGSQYKRLTQDTFVAKLIKLPKKIEEILSDRYGIQDIEACKKHTHKILEISNPTNLIELIKQKLDDILSYPDINTAKFQIASLLTNMGYLQNHISYYNYMRKIFNDIVLHNITKGSKILNIELKDIDYKSSYELLDLYEILRVQNNVSRDETLGYIWVLNTCVFIIPDFNFKLTH